MPWRPARARIAHAGSKAGAFPASPRTLGPSSVKGPLAKVAQVLHAPDLHAVLELLALKPELSLT